jgi:MoxR-vWA-beta-propeller ternary system domain bpX2
MHPWAACLSDARADDFAALRLFPAVEVAVVGGVWWLRGEKLDQDLQRELKKIPRLVVFEILVSQRLRLVASRIPDRTLPPAVWRPVKEAVAVTLPIAALAGEARQKIQVTLVRTAAEQAAAALQVGLDAWAQYATEAPTVRLRPLRFAAMEERQVLILGHPLPGISGKGYAESSGIFVPCGFTWSPRVDAAVLRQLLNLKETDIALLAEDNTHQVIHAEQFVPASRSATRNTVNDWANA